MIIYYNGVKKEATEEEIVAFEERLNKPEVAKAKKEAEIFRLKTQLNNTDYKAIKYAEGWISAEEYSTIKIERQALRDRINALEIEVKELQVLIEEQEKAEDFNLINEGGVTDDT